MWLVFALLAALSAGVVVVLSKAGLKKVEPALAFAIQAVLMLAISWGVVAARKEASGIGNIDRPTWIYLIAAGVLTAASSLFTFRALKLGDAAVVSPVERLSLVFAILLAAFFLKEKITVQVIIGAALMAAGAVVIALAKK